MRLLKDFWLHAFGSDEQSPYSALYTWLANQMSHAAMGFVLMTVTLLLVLTVHGDAPQPAIANNLGRRLLATTSRLSIDWYVVVLFALIPLKEVVDISTDRLAARSLIDLNLQRIFFDSITDIAFWWTGMFMACILVAFFVVGTFRLVVPVVGLAVCAFFLVFAAPRWMDQKRVFDLSRLPLGFKRLCVLAGEQRSKPFFAGDQTAMWGELERLRASIVKGPAKPPQRHTIILGGTPAARSELAVALGCEHALRLRPRKHRTSEPVPRTRYTTAVAGLEAPMAFDEFKAARLECIIIDDLDVSLGWLVDLSSKSEIDVSVRQSKVVESIESIKASMEAHPAASAARESVASAVVDSEPSPVLRNQDRILFLGAQAKREQISTIWALAGERRDKWEVNKERWIDQLTVILGTPREEFLIIQLADAASDTKERIHAKRQVPAKEQADAK